jgi:hypothetical protein
MDDKSLTCVYHRMRDMQVYTVPVKLDGVDQIPSN